MRKLDDKMFVSGQLLPEDVPALAEAGIRTIINNRPDGEQPGQPDGAEMEQAAHAAGLDYHAIPVRGLSQEQVDGMRAVLETANGPVLAFCAYGTRSTFLWALARAEAGDDGAEIIRKATDAGYDLSPIAAFLRGE